MNHRVSELVGQVPSRRPKKNSIGSRHMRRRCRCPTMSLRCPPDRSGGATRGELPADAAPDAGDPERRAMFSRSACSISRLTASRSDSEPPAPSRRGDSSCCADAHQALSAHVMPAFVGFQLGQADHDVGLDDVLAIR
jgi:hypothetical protein